MRITPLASFILVFLLLSGSGKSAVAPVGQLPSVTVSMTPSIHALPILLVEESGEWKDFGIQVTLKVHACGEEQLDRVTANEWDVAVMDPFYAVKGGNEGNVAIVGIAGNFANQIPFILGRGGASPSQGKFREWLKASISGAGLKGNKVFLPACLVATAAYADTRQTLVIRWLEGYSRGIRIIQKNPAAAASRLKEFYQDKLRVEVSAPALQQEIGQAFYLEEKEREEPFRGKEGKPGALEEFAASLTNTLKGLKALESSAAPADYILPRLWDQLSALRKEAIVQLEKSGAAVVGAAKAGVQVKEFRKTWEEARMQVEDGRGCLTVIGVLSDLQRSAEQARVATGRLNDFRKIELGIGVVLGLYYAGYFLWRAKKGSYP